MRTILLAAIVLAPVSALAGHRGGGSGGGGGGGALSHVSSGMGRASGSSSPRGSSSSSSSGTTVVVVDRPRYVEGVRVNTSGQSEGNLPEEAIATPAARFEGYLGVQKVHDSDESFTAELAITDRWARIGGAVTRFYEQQPGGQNLTMTMPEFTIGARVDQSPGNKVFLEVGVVGAKTQHDPVMDTSVVGGLAGLRFETQLAPRASLLGTVQLMLFEDNIRAAVARVGARLGPVEASLRVVDFNIGPPLYGPELGVRF